MLEQILKRIRGKKETAADRRVKKSRHHKSYVPPRSMTEAEKAHYDQHKNLNNFYK